LRLTGEALRLQSWRNQRLATGAAPEEIDHQLQLSVRVFF
jgi:hypothetical protein